MSSTQRTEPIFFEPHRVQPTKRRRHRRHRILKGVILLTVPFYCIGFTLLTMLRIDAIVSRAASSPMFLGGLLLFAFLVLAEPWTGAVTNSCAVGAKCAGIGLADPISCLGLVGGCLTVIGFLGGLVAFGVWLL